METLAPYIFGVLHRVEAHMHDLYKYSPARANGYNFLQLRRSVIFLRRQVMLYRLAEAKKDLASASRHLKLIYGSLEMIRPELRSALETVIDAQLPTERGLRRTQVH